MTTSHHDHSGHSGGRSPSRGGVSRRQFLAGAAGVGALAIPSGRIAASSALASTRAGQAGGLPSMQEVWGWQEQLVRFGTRYTGSPGHAAYVDWLTSQLAAVPGFTVQTDRLTFNRWLARDYTLQVSVPAAVGASGPVPLTYYYPYSGQTPPHGVTAKLVDLGIYPPAVSGVSGYTTAFWAAASGAIALVRAALPVFSLDIGQTATGGYEPGKSSVQAAADYTAYAAALPHPAWQGIFDPVPLLDARNAGVLGVVIAWTGLPDDEIINQYNPFTTGYPAASGLPTPGDPGCPAVWVGDATGAELSRLAASGQASATLVLTADITAGAATETVWGGSRAPGTPARTSSSTRTPTGRTPPRRTAAWGSSRSPGIWPPFPHATATCTSPSSPGTSSCRSSPAPSPTPETSWSATTRPASGCSTTPASTGPRPSASRPSTSAPPCGPTWPGSTRPPAGSSGAPRTRCRATR